MPTKTKTPKTRSQPLLLDPNVPPNPCKTRVLLVDDHPLMRAGLVQLLSKHPGVQITWEAGNAQEAMLLLTKDHAQPDLVITDITMPGKGGLDFIKDLIAFSPTLRILVISMHDESLYAERALRAGARGYIMKEAGGEKLLDAIERVLSGQMYVSPEMSLRILDNLSGPRPRGSHSPIEKLTDREFDVFRMIGQGKSTRDIAQELHISTKTVDVHRGHIKEKLSLKGATSLVRHAVRWVETQNLEFGLRPKGIS